MKPSSYNYSKYKNFGYLCEVPKDVLNNLQEYYDILQKVPCAQMKTEHYKQWFVQTSHSSNSDIDIVFDQWTDGDFLKITKDFFHDYVETIFRFRFSHLVTDGILGYHTKHHLPRIHIPLDDSDSLFVIKDNDGVEHSYKLEYGSAHFINVTHLHKVVSTKNVDRKNSFFSFVEFKDKKIEEQFLK